jgi:hypothetical protein
MDKFFNVTAFSDPFATNCGTCDKVVDLLLVVSFQAIELNFLSPDLFGSLFDF